MRLSKKFPVIEGYYLTTEIAEDSEDTEMSIFFTDYPLWTRRSLR